MKVIPELKSNPLASSHLLPAKRLYTRIFLSAKDSQKHIKFIFLSKKMQILKPKKKKSLCFLKRETWRRRWVVCEERQWGQMLRQQSIHKMFFSFFLTSSWSKQALKNLSFNKTSSHAGNSPDSICKIKKVNFFNETQKWIKTHVSISCFMD